MSKYKPRIVDEKTKKRSHRMFPVEYLSKSSISTYLSCGRSWFYRYVLKRPYKQNGAAFFGSVFHACIQNWLVDGKKQPLEDYWAKLWPQMVKAEEPKGGIEWKDENPQDVYNEGWSMCQDPNILTPLCNLTVMKDGHGYAIEKRFSVQLQGAELPIVGYIDLITEDGVPVDFKTTGRAWADDKAAQEIQPLFYLYAMEKIGMPSPDNKFVHVVIVRGKKPKIQWFVNQYKPEQYEWISTLAKSVETGIKKGVFPYADPGSWLCGSKYCDFWAECRGKYYPETQTEQKLP